MDIIEPLEFMKGVFPGLHMSEFQKAMLCNPNDEEICQGRLAGKTTGIVIKACYEALSAVDKSIVIVVLDTNRQDHMLRKVVELIGTSSVFGKNIIKRISHNPHKIVLSNGSVIRIYVPRPTFYCGLEVDNIMVDDIDYMTISDIRDIMDFKRICNAKFISTKTLEPYPKVIKKHKSPDKSHIQFPEELEFMVAYLIETTDTLHAQPRSRS